MTAHMAGFDTVYPADSLEFCPHPLFNDIFVCGTYKLDEDSKNSTACELLPQHRRGQCLVFFVSDQEQDEPSFQKIQEIDLPAVPDMKWCHRSESRSPLLGIADSEGHITLHEWNSHERKLNLRDSITCAPSDVLCLSLDWSNRRYPGAGLGSLVVSLANGRLALLQPDDQGSLALTESWPAHDYEPWIAAWDYWNTNTIYSGGDDLQLKCWDIRQDFMKPVFSNRRFEAGVTTLQSHPHTEYLIAVGGYDDSVRIFDTRKFLAPIINVDTGGGAWRVKWHPSPSRAGDLLVACMHDGFKVLHFDELGGIAPTEATISERFNKHESLAYGADWSFGAPNPRTGKTLIGSCSFYDHRLHLWSG